MAGDLDRPEPAGVEAANDSWPRTTRVLPWMLAGFIAILWLVPFNTISLTASLPFDIHLDRIVLPFIVAVWVLVLATGGKFAPRLQMTPIHWAIGSFVVVALLSVAVNVGSLNTALEFNSSLKQLMLLLSYVTVFLMIASVVRGTEVQAFLKYTLILGVLCALGTLWEYRYHYNVFYAWSGKILPGIFSVQAVNSSGFDEIGRRQVIGPGELGLETAAMLSMALPLALVGVMHSKQRRPRIWYGLAAIIIIAAGLSTYRKTALIAPVVVIITLGVFRRRELLRLAPFGVLLIGAVHVLSPGAIGGVVDQLTGNQLTTVNTTSHRTEAYDAIRPLVWSHPVLGQGYGSYNAFVNRILDNQILDNAIEIGAVGVAAYILMIMSVPGMMLRLIRGRTERAPPALACAAGAVAFLTVSLLYDSMSFPHAPYIFLTFAGFAAVLVRSPGRGP